jgi:hypothetical protein
MLVTYPRLLRGLITLAQLSQPIVFLLLEVWLLLDLGLVQPVDDGILSLRD